MLQKRENYREYRDREKGRVGRRGRDGEPMGDIKGSQRVLET